MRLRRLGTIVGVVALAAGSLAAEPATEPAAPESDSSQLLAFTMRLETVAGSDLVGSELDWVHRKRERVVTLGISSSRIDDSRWLYAKAGAARRVSEKTFLSAAVDLGEGERAGSSFGYRKLRARVTRLAVAKRAELHAELQSYEIGRFHGTLASVGAAYRFKPTLGVGLGYSELIAGNSASRIVFGRIDLERSLGWFAGFAHGTQGPDLARIALGLESDADYFEIYAGVSIPIRDQRLLVFLDLSEHGEVQRRAIVASWRLRRPAAKRGAGG